MANSAFQLRKSTRYPRFSVVPRGWRQTEMRTQRRGQPQAFYPTEPPKNESVSSPKSVAGFLLLDPDLRPVSFNAETIQILSYPEDIGNVADSQLFLENKIRSILMTEASLGELLRKAPCSRP